MLRQRGTASTLPSFGLDSTTKRAHDGAVVPKNLVRTAIIGTLIVAMLFFGYRHTSSTSSSPKLTPSRRVPLKVRPPPLNHAKLSHHVPGSVMLVVAASATDDTSWTSRFGEWQSAVYATDQHVEGKLQVPTRADGTFSGGEAMAYLTYITKHYNALPETMIFVRGQRAALKALGGTGDGDLPELLEKLKFDYIEQEGYVNLQCTSVPRCPAEREGLILHGTSGNVELAAVVSQAWPALFGPLEPMPVVIAAPGGSMFAVRKEVVQRRKLAEYVRMRNWLVESEVRGQMAGMVFENLWQAVFGWDAINCPSVSTCRSLYDGRK